MDICRPLTVPDGRAGARLGLLRRKGRDASPVPGLPAKSELCGGDVCVWLGVCRLSLTAGMMFPALKVDGYRCPSMQWLVQIGR